MLGAIEILFCANLRKNLFSLGLVLGVDAVSLVLPDLYAPETGCEKKILNFFPVFPRVRFALTCLDMGPSGWKRRTLAEDSRLPSLSKISLVVDRGRHDSCLTKEEQKKSADVYLQYSGKHFPLVLLSCLHKFMHPPN